jgi:hypothetical protein
MARELAHGDNGSGPILEVRGVMDLRHYKPRLLYTAHGENGEVSADARSHDDFFIRRPGIGEQIGTAVTCTAAPESTTKSSPLSSGLRR